MKFRILIVLGLLGAKLLVASPDPPLQPGEKLRYSVSWAIVPGAGEINVSAESDPTTPGRLKVTTVTATRRLARLLLPFEATAESVYDLANGELLSLHEWSSTRGKHAEHRVTFDHANQQAVYGTIGETTSRVLPMPAGHPADLIMALLETRTWDLKPGEARDVLVLFDDEFYELTIHALRYENVSTMLGRFNALVLEPRMEKTPPKGMFKRGTSVRVWIAQDAHKLPVKFEVEFKIGTGTAVLESYTPPTGAAAAPATAGR